VFTTILLFFVGFYILIKGANFLVDGSSSLARKFNLPSLVIGLVIAGIGTSIPEFAISFIANLQSNTSIGLGTIIGSNTFNLLFILGATAFFFPLKMKKEWVDRDLVWNVVAVAIALFFAGLLGAGTISRPEGVLLLLVFFIWIFKAVHEKEKSPEDNRNLRILTLPLTSIMIIGGLVGVILGGKWVVDGAVEIAAWLGIPGALIGLTIVGIGTSLPELTVSFVAAFKKRPGLALGNIIGSNIFDFLMILGFAAVIKPIIFPNELLIHAVVTLVASFFLYGLIILSGKKYTLERWHGLVLVLFYILYVLSMVGQEIGHLV
jgi:cation:H+ antiporter